MLRFLELNSIRSRTVSGFLFLTFLILILALVSLYLLDKTRRIVDIHSNVNQLQVFTLALFKTDNDFFDLEATSEEYFRSHNSDFLRRRDSLLSLISRIEKKVLEADEEKLMSVRENLVDIDRDLKVYNRNFRKIEQLRFDKGYRDYGIEGKMRFHAQNWRTTYCPKTFLPFFFYGRTRRIFSLEMTLHMWMPLTEKRKHSKNTYGTKRNTVQIPWLCTTCRHTETLSLSLWKYNNKSG